MEVAAWAFRTFGFMLIILCILKTWNLANSMRWAIHSGAHYAAAVLSSSEAVKAHELLMNWPGSDFRPFGAKSVKLERLRNRLPWLLRLLIFRWYSHTPIYLASIALFCTVFHVLSRQYDALEDNGWNVALVIALALWLGVHCLLLQSEAVTWYVIARDYTRVWGGVKFHITGVPTSGAAEKIAQHGDTAEKSALVGATADKSAQVVTGEADVAISGDGASRRLSDVIALSAITVTSMAGLSSCIATLTVIGSNFGDHADQTLLRSITSAAYFVASNLSTVGGSALAPESAVGDIAALLVSLSTLLTIAFAVSAIGARIGGDDGR